MLLTFPVRKFTRRKKEALVVKSAKKISPPSSNPSYIEKLLNEREIIKLEKEFDKSKNAYFKSSEKVRKAKKIKKVKVVKKSVLDKIKLKQSGLKKEKIEVKKTKKNDSTLLTYGLKFAAFLGLMLAFFYGICILFKKGFFKKSRLGFLNGTKVVEVLSTTHIGPKRSLLTIKVSEQIILVGVDEKGMHMLTEVKDPTHLLKEGERKISGNNFDTDLGKAETQKKDFKLKEPFQVKPQEKEKVVLKSVNSPATTKKEYRGTFSDQIRSKVKELKSFQ